MYDFDERLKFSKGTRQRTDAETIQQMIDGCVQVDVTDEQLDRQGIDYIATLQGGACVYIDAKARDKGASKYWKDGIPDLALEDWSAIPENGNQGRVGWTLDQSKKTNLVLFTFDSSDTDRCYLVSFQLLRIAFERNLDRWVKEYKDAPQYNKGWTSHCVFVPVRQVFLAIMRASCGRANVAD